VLQAVVMEEPFQVEEQHHRDLAVEDLGVVVADQVDHKEILEELAFQQIQEITVLVAVVELVVQGQLVMLLSVVMVALAFNFLQHLEIQYQE